MLGFDTIIETPVQYNEVQIHRLKKKNLGRPLRSDQCAGRVRLRNE